MSKQTQNIEKITLAGGCFWCIEAVFQELKGVENVVSGYMGGHLINPTYNEVCSGNSGHAEVVQIKFDPNLISLETILDVFWSVHDPTTLNRQGNDVGTQYRSAIFYYNSRQQAKAIHSLDRSASQLWSNKIYTEIVPATKFYIAEETHQQFYNLNPNYGYCNVIINPKLEKFRKKFASILNH